MDVDPRIQHLGGGTWGTGSHTVGRELLDTGWAVTENFYPTVSN
jgi:hypothetical protein